MLKGKKIIVVMPAYNAARTLSATYHEVPHEIVDEVIMVDDKSYDETVQVAKKLGILTIQHDYNKGMAATRRPVTKLPWNGERISSLCCIPITNIPPG